MNLVKVALTSALLSASLQAQVIDDFESGNLNAYTLVSGSLSTVTAAAAQAGAFGCEITSSAWHYRTDVTVSPGDTMRAHVRTGSASGGRIYVGFGADAAGCWSGVLSPNTGELLLQQNAGYGYANMATTPFVYTANIWYTMEIDWAANGDVIVNMYDEAGTTLLASTPVAPGPVVAGGFAMRGFTGPKDIDNVLKVSSSTIIDDFESGNLNAYTNPVGGGVSAVTAAAAQAGAFGCDITASAWHLRTDVTISPGEKMRAHVRTGTATGGRIYMGFAADAAGCWSAVLSPNTGELLLQQNAGYGYANMATTPFTYAANIWYTMEVDWAANGDVIVNMYREDGTTLLASTPVTPGPVTAGGFAMRGFTGPKSIDNVEKNGAVGDNTGAAYCFGDGTGANCPCSAFGAPGEGCANTTGSGAILTGSGNASFGADSFQLDISGVPGDKPGLILRGDNQVAVPAGDGILCTAGASQRSHVQITNMGSTTFTDFNGAPFGSVANGGGVATNFQFWYRDPSNLCTGTGFNFTNAWAVTYAP